MDASVSIDPMADWRDDDRLNPTDRGILELLEEGRETTGSLARQLDRHPQTVRDRLGWLREWEYIRYHDEETGLHELRPVEERDDD
jgi:predicted ArsR family transcriptional regulator